MSFSAADLLTVLRGQLPEQATGFAVALSGGPDSSALLAAMCALRGALTGLSLRAIHVDHGLQAASQVFVTDCARLCRELDVPLTVVVTPVGTPPGGSLEAAAREARYAGLAATLAPGECLLTAHHGGDQAETFLLQGLRGAGLKGLASMPARRRCGAGWHIRPLLGAARADVLRLGAYAGFPGSFDPMNADARYDRVYLRGRVWPALVARWPGAASGLARAAAHAAEAQELLNDIAAADVTDLRDGDALSLPRLRRLSGPRQINVVRCWIAGAEVRPPSTVRLREALRQMFAARADQLPAMCWGEHALRRYRDRLFLTAAVPPRILAVPGWDWCAQPELDLGPRLGRLRCVERRGGLARERLPPTLDVVRRGGGETLKPAQDAATQTVAHLCQAAGVLPWLRDALPFVVSGKELFAVGDLWLESRFRTAATRIGVGFEWRDGPKIV
jgi:tRNA(Ile)-lysidine synthase